MKLLLLLACARNPTPAGVPVGDWVFSGVESGGELQIRGDRCKLGLWSAMWRVGEEGPVDCLIEVVDGEVWIHFPLEMGAGEGQGVIALEHEKARLPLGARKGEWEVVLDRTEGTLSSAQRADWVSTAAKGLASELAGWELGLFRLLDGERLVGALNLTAAPTVDLYDSFWTTQSAEAVLVKEEGPDLVLAFSVMPSLEGEPGVLRVNRPTRNVVVPLGSTPTPGERRLRIEPGVVDPEERERAVQEAGSAADQHELEVILPLFRELYESVLGQNCQLESSVRQQTELLLPGYVVSTDPEAKGCRLDLEPDPPQHGRRAAIRMLQGGEPEWVFRPIR